MTDPKSHPQTVNKPVADAPQSSRDGPATRSIIAAEIGRGVTRMLMAQGIGAIAELPLPDGRRADIVGLAANGAIVVVEIKSSVADFACDLKWSAYRAYCDRLYFAVPLDFPAEMLPQDTGLILADRYGASIVREAPDHPMAPARRKVMMARFGLAAAARLARLRDPGIDVMAEF